MHENYISKHENDNFALHFVCTEFLSLNIFWGKTLMHGNISQYNLIPVQKVSCMKESWNENVLFMHEIFMQRFYHTGSFLHAEEVVFDWNSAYLQYAGLLGLFGMLQSTSYTMPHVSFLLK